jgi:MFS family permease
MSAPEAPSNDLAQLRGAFFRVFPGVSLVMILAVADNPIVATALPAIAADLRSADRVSLVVVSYMLAAMVSAPVYGLLGDVLGLRRMTFISLGIFVTGGALCASAQSLHGLVLCRILQGLGGGGLMVLAQALLAQALPPRERGRFQGYLGVVVVVSQGCGPLLGGILTATLGWPAVFLIALPLGGLATIMLLRVPPLIGRGGEFRVDFVGIALLASALSATMATLFAMQDIVHADGMWLALSAAAATILIAILIQYQSRARYPLFPRALFRNPTIVRCALLALAHGGFLVSTIVFMPMLFRVRYGLTIAELGLAIVPLSLGIIVGAALTGNLVTRTGRTTVWGVMGMGGCTILLFTLAILPELPSHGLRAVLAGIGFLSGTVMGPVQIMVASATGKDNLGSASASVQFARMLGSALGTAVTSVVMFLTLQLHGPIAVEIFTRQLAGSNPSSSHAAIDHAFSAVFILLALAALAACILALRVPLKRV